MKLATLSKNGKSFVALIDNDSYIDVSKHLADAPHSMIDIIRQWDSISAQIKTIEAKAPDGKISDVTVEAPLARPGKIMCMGLNYADHCEETDMAIPEEQVWFSKPATAVHAPFAPIEIPACSDSLDYEVEMVAIIGKTCKNVPADKFEEVVFGYATANDVSVREWQLATSQWVLGKSFDKSAPFGPYITTGDAVDPHGLDIKCYVNDELRQSSNTKHLVFNVGDMIAKLSQAMTLEPGDIIFTGTPGGVGLMWKGSPHYLKAGDVLTSEIEGLGTIKAVVENGSSETQIA